MVTVVRQRAAGDCGIAALATFLSARCTYEDVHAAVATIDRVRQGELGLTNAQLLKVARRLELELTPVRSYDLDVDEGILRARAPAWHPEGHWLAVRYGLVWDPADGFAAPWREYRRRHRARLGTLLRSATRGGGRAARQRRGGRATASSATT